MTGSERNELLPSGQEAIEGKMVLGENVFKAGRVLEEYELRPWKDRSNKERLEKYKDCALAISKYLEALIYSDIAEIGEGPESWGISYKISTLDRGIWKDMAEVLKSPQKASPSEIWLANGVLLSKYKELSYRYPSENSQIINCTMKAYWGASCYLRELYPQFTLSSGCVNDITHLPIKIP